MRFVFILGWLLPLLAHGSQAERDQLPDGLYAVFQLERGTFVAELDYEIIPLTVANFVGLAEGTIPNTFRELGEPFYDGLTFHRVVPGFVAQGGDPLGNGAGDPGYTFPDEFSPRLKHDAVGVLAMANGGPNTNGCQFYFTLSPVTRLDYKHSVFGRVVQGVELLPQIEPDEVIKKVQIVRRGEAAEGFRPNAESFHRMRESVAVMPSRDPTLPPLFANESRLVVPGWYEPWINEKLHHYAAVTGVTIHVRLVPRMIIPEVATENPLRFAHAQWAGSDPDAATLLYVDSEDRWRVWLGDGLLGRFGLTPETAAAEAGRAVLRDLRQIVLEKAGTLLGADTMHRSIDAAVSDLIGELDATGHQ